MPFFENTEILQRDVQVLDHILTVEIKTHFILNLQRPTITTANAWASQWTLQPDQIGGLVAQAFAVVIVGLCKFNIKWVLISIVKIWSKTCTSRRSISVFRMFYMLVGLGGLPVFRFSSVLFSNRFFRFSFYKNRKTVITKLFTVNARNSIIILKTWQ